MAKYVEFETLLGKVIDKRFKVRDFLGEGGQACVLRAWDTEARKLVALKVLRPSKAIRNSSFKRFEREAFALTKLDAPNCLKSYGLRRDDLLKIDYMVMDLVEGQPLDLFIDFPLSTRQVLCIGIGVARGLAEAHSKGIFHRDLKPENVIITPQKTAVEHKPVLIDFGIAKFSEGYEMTWITATDKVVGTVHYMSPEQAQGLPLDGRTDIYSLGVVLYELLSGDPPFDGTPIQILQAHLGQDPPRLKPKVSLHLNLRIERMLERCLDKDRDLRFHSGESITTELEGISKELGETSLSPATALRLSSQDKLLAIGFESGEVEVRSMKTGESIDRYHGHSANVIGVGWLNDGASMVSVDEEGGLCLWKGKRKRKWKRKRRSSRWS